MVDRKRLRTWALSLLTPSGLVTMPMTGAGASKEAAACVDSPIVRWTGGAGANSHFYQAICAEVDWDQAKAAAEAKGGHLATLNSAEENGEAGQGEVRPGLITGGTP